jgi:hypothetical protein
MLPSYIPCSVAGIAVACPEWRGLKDYITGSPAIVGTELQWLAPLLVLFL